MPVELIEIVNPNGRKGLVPATSRAAREYKRPPSARDEPDLTAVAALIAAGDLPPLNATTKFWRAYALAKGLPSEQVTTATRDDLIARLTNPNPES
jgi:hypothetical protein